MKDIFISLFKLIRIIKTLILWGLLIILLLTQNWIKCNLTLNGDKVLEDIDNIKKRFESIENK